MLTGTKSISLSFQSMIEGKSAVYMSAQIPENGKSTVNKNIVDLDLYEANKVECRKDMADFEVKIYELEDQNMEGTADETK